MRIPQNKSLREYIRELIKKDKLEQFYITDDWRELREEILRDFHYECQECLKKGTYTKADCVHHINEVRHRPDLALSRHYIDEKGMKQLNLIPLCNTCHNIIHEKLTKFKRKDMFTNEEKW